MDSVLIVIGIYVLIFYLIIKQLKKPKPNENEKTEINSTNIYTQKKEYTLYLFFLVASILIGISSAITIITDGISEEITDMALPAFFAFFIGFFGTRYEVKINSLIKKRQYVIIRTFVEELEPYDGEAAYIKFKHHPEYFKITKTEYSYASQGDPYYLYIVGNNFYKQCFPAKYYQIKPGDEDLIIDLPNNGSE